MTSNANTKKFSTPALRARVRELKDTGVRQYAIARRSGYHPSIWNQILMGARAVREDDQRAHKAARLVDLDFAVAFSDVDPFAEAEPAVATVSAQGPA